MKQKGQGRYGPPIAAAVIMASIVGGMLAMPSVMRRVSEFGGGPLAGAILGVGFLTLLFVVLWLRGRYQARKRVN